jgi:hypothetical protein
MRRLVLLLAAGLLLVACGQLGSPAPSASSGPPTTLTDDRPLATATPGATLQATAEQICTPGWSTQHRHGLTAAQKRRVLAAYGLQADQPVAEWDHLISLELGGANGTRNIWPELSADDAHRKDRLENALHRQVCAGQLDLAAAQDRVRQFWRYW